MVDPDDPSKLLPTTDPKTPVIPDVPGTTPIGPDGKPLTPIDPNDPGKGYIPPTPADPGASTPIEYVADPQKATVTYQDVNDAAAPQPLGTVDELDGKAGTTSSYTTAARIAELVAQGYILKDDGYPAAGVVFDDDPNVDQAFIVTFTHGTATITPEAPGKPGDPIDANDPDGPKWPAGSDDVSGLKQDVTEVITYVDNTGAEVASSHNDVVSFVTTATVDLTNGTVTIDPNWTVATKNADGTADTTFDAVTSPAVPGYYADKGTIAAVTGITKDTANVVEQVTYNKLGGWTPTDPSLPPIDYVVDPEDPSQLLPTTDPKTPVIPDVPGTTPIGPDGKPLQPVDPNDPGKGYVPPTPIDPGTPTPIDYVADPQKATVTYQDVSDADAPKTLGDVETLEGQSGATSPYTTVARIAELVAQGYVLKDDAYPTAGVVFDNDTNVDQAFVVTFTHGTATITPDQPGKPGDPIDPENPDGPKWPQGSDDITTLKKDVKQTITYVDSTGAEVAPTYSATISFTRDGTVDLVTGTITPNTNSTAPDSTTFKAVTSPLIDGYFADIATVDEIKDVTAETADTATQVVYQKLGGWTTPDGQPIPYPNDPNNPGGILDPADPKAPVIPYVPGKTPQGPDGQPLTPKDPNDPTQGYVPPTPVDLSKDTPITYVDNDTGGNPGTGGGTGTTPGTGGGSGTTPGTGGATGTTPDTSGTSTPPNTGTTPEATPPARAPIAPEEVGESGTGIAQQPADVPTASGTGNVAQTAAGNGNLGTGALSTPSNAPTVAPQGTAETAANAKNAAQSLPQTDESTSIWARIGLALIGALGLAGLASRRKKEE